METWRKVSIQKEAVETGDVLVVYFFPIVYNKWFEGEMLSCYASCYLATRCSAVFGNGMVWDRPGRLFIASKSCWFAQTLAQAFHNVKNFGNAVQVTENRPRALNFQSHQPIIQSRDLSREQCVSFLGAHPGQCVSSVVYAHVYLSNKKNMRKRFIRSYSPLDLSDNRRRSSVVSW